jgi:hypothetical protein
MKNQKIRDDFFAHTQEIIEYFAGGKTGASNKKELARQMLLISHANVCLYSLFTYIDGASGVKNLELVNADTGDAIAEGTLHEDFINYLKTTIK